MTWIKKGGAAGGKKGEVRGSKKKLPPHPKDHATTGFSPIRGQGGSRLYKRLRRPINTSTR